MRILGLFLKMLKIILITLPIFAVVYIFVLGTQMSATYPPLKTYAYEVPEDELYKTFVTLVSKDAAWTLDLADSVGPADERRYYYELHKRTQTDSLTFNLSFKKADRWFDRKTKSQLSVTSAWDRVKWKGGYKMDDPDVKLLLQIFENEIIVDLQSNADR